MAVQILIPTPLRVYTRGEKVVTVEAGTVGEALRALTERFPELQRHLFNEEGRLRSFVNLYLGDEDVRYLQGEETPISDGQTLSIVPSIAGGGRWSSGRWITRR
ncbi:MoaD/ThiS family protein [Thermoflexus sp.]|uniref:MoaD/ThiS family protein n=1 Tax=Thermoflexus sp. TaxID=1969742 RepID=UPI0017575003|nr:MoaD/ThiS family protein [Thermoflexus sp.]